MILVEGKAKEFVKSTSSNIYTVILPGFVPKKNLYEVYSCSA
jgi:hypothetical protein